MGVRGPDEAFEGVPLDAGEPGALGPGRVDVVRLEAGRVGQQLMVGLAVVERGPRQLGDLGVSEGFLHHPKSLVVDHGDPPEPRRRTPLEALGAAIGRSERLVPESYGRHCRTLGA